MKKMQCELCKDKARIFCEPDHAYLCWDCDATVHSANFLVARHSRNILCHLCRSPTPWQASGPKLTPTLCLCQQCLLFIRGRHATRLEDGYGSVVCEKETVDDNQVVSWSPPPPPSSSDDDEEGDSISGGENSVRAVEGGVCMAEDGRVVL